MIRRFTEVSFEPSGFSTERGGYDGYVAESSLYTKASFHPWILGGVLSAGLTPFKANAKPVHGSGDPLWTRLFHFYSCNREWFEKQYHKRSNSETTNAMIKIKFGERLRSRTEVAQYNELLCKVLCHNICVTIQSFYELGIEPKFWGDDDKKVA
jgi:hypothetical protein